MSVLNFLNLITHCGYGENVFVLKGVKGSDLCSLFSNGSEKKKKQNQRWQIVYGIYCNILAT